MRIAELSRRTGVPVPTIKYYLREGLLPAGELTSPNQARYDEAHLHRLRLVRALAEVGGLSIAAVREVLGALDDPEKSLHKAMGTVEVAVSSPVAVAEDAVAHAQAREFVERQGWTYRPRSDAFQSLVGVLATARELGHERFVGQLDGYARACGPLAEQDLDYVLGAPTKDAALEVVVVGTVLGDAALAAVRRLARREASGRREDAERGSAAGEGDREAAGGAAEGDADCR
ncbi:MerR family transcriptional regulator [Saccharothrix australiensis]|uniref:MerR-like DNA binding protein n=1 Tax=Saccharothrix australiensis TaxID=2072 RepID=A0A495VW87_9PSEU|nr:MerR family transcriptional regulator [Saccharothrix australiensis]RKT53464.1 MerR-like DNA binding protein [Saccharothrix australiensis]